TGCNGGVQGGTSSMIGVRAADNPRGFVLFRPGQVSLLLRPRNPNFTPALRVEDLVDLERQVRPGAATTHFHPNPCQLADNERDLDGKGLRSSVVSRRAYAQTTYADGDVRHDGTRVLQTVNLATWQPYLNVFGITSDMLDPLRHVRE